MTEELGSDSTEGGARSTHYAIVVPVFLVDEVTGRRLVAIMCTGNQSTDAWLVDESDLGSGEVECWRSECRGLPPHTLIPLEEAFNVRGLLEVDEGCVILGISDILSGLLKLRRAEPEGGPRPLPREALG